jgi:hypothetical protein
MITFVFLAVAVAVALWPSSKSLDSILPKELQKTDTPVTYLEAVAALQVVRARLSKTGELDEPSSDACNILTLGLSAGSHTE